MSRRAMRRFKYRWTPVLFCLAALRAYAADATDEEPTVLSPGGTEVREIRGGERHVYQVEAAAGD